MNTEGRSTAPAIATVEQAAEAVRQAELIEQPDRLDAVTRHLSSAPAVGLDTEFVRERTFFARPGLIQISNGHDVWLADPVAVDAMPQLGSLLAGQDSTKVLHSVGEDLEVLHQVTGEMPDPLFDTQIAAAMLGKPLQCRYEHLVEMEFGVHLPGGKARNDWCRRPLSPSLLEYAAQDVIWLPRLFEHLSEQLQAHGRLDWLQEDCARLLDQARCATGPAPLERVKGAGRLPDEVLALVARLADWRESQAIERDLPRRFVLGDEQLIEFARAALDKGPSSALSSLKPGMRRRHGDHLTELVISTDPDAFQRPAWLDPLDNEQRAQLKKSQTVVRELAEELKVDPALIASKKELTRLLRGERPEWLSGWRGTYLTERLAEASVNIPPA
ncbi:HRDC domain-containing protein [Wenzhouxiangella sp. AB-CW3]|uniref:ribonuclease D n=1 Tax=Wenzhouxiangella sp. AB-CW3 TaxID=2771012 RepID=UPI00168A98EF|nr:HRDC domain-containing protein [Wenzhouxiangella sp. AB-CW3]QOC21512.1 HRDC domain-containing protein [Wenzhouxiangella sp. AB-CW3]